MNSHHSYPSINSGGGGITNNPSHHHQATPTSMSHPSNASGANSYLISPHNPSSSAETHYVSALGFIPASSDIYEEPFIQDQQEHGLYQANLYHHSQKPSINIALQQEQFIQQQQMLMRKKQLSIDVKQAAIMGNAPIVLQQQYYNSGANSTTSASGHNHPRTGSQTSSSSNMIINEENKQRNQMIHPQNLPRGGSGLSGAPTSSYQQKGGYQPSHIPKKKSIPSGPISYSHHGHSGSIGSTYKPTNLAMMQNTCGTFNNTQRNSIGGQVQTQQDTNPYTNLGGVRSKSLSGQQQTNNEIQSNQPINHFKNSVSVGGPILQTSNVVLHPNTPGGLYQQPLQGQLTWIQNSDQKAQQYIVLNNGQQILVADPSTLNPNAFQNQQHDLPINYVKKGVSSEFAQHSIQRLQRYEQLQQKQKMVEAKNGQVFNLNQNSSATTMYQEPQKILQNQQFFGQEQQQHYNPSPQMNPYMTQFSNNSNKLSLQGSNIQSPIIGVSNQSLMFDSTDSINNLQLHSLAINPHQTSQANQLQTQSSNYSSSGNISSSWLSQSNASLQQVKASPQSSMQPLILQNQHEPNCQCTSCLKQQMAQLQQLLQKQSQIFFQQQQQQQPLKQQAFISPHIPAQSQLQTNYPNVSQPTINIGASNGGLQNQSQSNLQNQSSSCWASSNSQLSPHSQSRSQTINSIHSSMRQSEADLNLEQPSQTASMDGDMLLTKQDTLKSCSQKGQNQKGLGKGNEDETIVEDQRRSENNSDESGSIPDEIEHLRNYNENQFADPSQIRFMYQQSEVIVDSTKKPRNQGLTTQDGQRYYSMQDGGSNDGSSGDTNNFDQPPNFWIPAQLPQNIQNQINSGSSGLQRKNYIELPMGEIPEMKESFYDEHSRWSQVFAGTANQSRNKTPSGNNQSQQNLNADQSSNINNSNSTSNKGDQPGLGTSKNHHLTEEEKEDLFLYSQGESGATFNRTENESSFLTSERNKLNQGLTRGAGGVQQDQQSDVTQVKVPGQSPSFEALKELSMSKSLEKLDLGTRIKKDQFEQEVKYSSNKKDEMIAQNNESNREEFKMDYPDTAQKKKELIQQEYSASSAKYLNQSLTLTPSQYQTHDDPTNNMNSSMYDQEQKSFPHMTLQYDQLTPIKNRDQQILSTLEDEGEHAAYQYLINQAVLQGQNNDNLAQSVDFKLLNEEEGTVGQQFKNMRSNSKMGISHNESVETQMHQREIILSPLPPLPQSLEGTPDANQLKRIKNHSQMSNQFPQVQIIQDQPSAGTNHHNSGRQSSLSYDKERANKIINYILNSDQKSSTHHLQNMRSSVLSKDSVYLHHHHRSNVLSQVNHIFPNLDEMEKELRTQKRQVIAPEERVLSIELETIKPQAQEEVLMWSASVSSTPKNIEVTEKIGPSAQTQPVSSKKQKSEDLSSSKQSHAGNNSQLHQSQLAHQRKTRDVSTSLNGTKYTMIDIKEIKSIHPATFQSRNVKSHTQKLPGSKKQVSVLDNNHSTSYSQRQAQHRIRSLDIDRYPINDRKILPNTGSNNAQRQNKSDERSAAQLNKSSRSNIESKSPFGLSEKQKYSKLTPQVQQQFRNQNPANEENSRNRTSNSPYFTDKNKQIFGALKQQQQNSFSKQNQYATSFQNRAAAANKLMQTKKAALQTNTLNHKSHTQSQQFIVPNKQPGGNLGVSKYLPSMFDRLKSKQVFATTQRVPNIQLPQTSAIEESRLANLAQANMYQSKTQRNDSSKSRPSQERLKNGGETRNSSRSSGANQSGNRKRKFSKIVFEISELPTAQPNNRSLSYKRQKDQLMRQTINPPKLTLQEQLAIKSKIEKEQRTFGTMTQLGNKLSISPKRQTMPTTSMSGIHLMPIMGGGNSHGMQKPNESNSRSYNSSSEFIVTHENFQIRQLSSEEASMPTQGSEMQVSQESMATKQSVKPVLNNSGPMQLQIQIQSRNQRSIGRQSQTEGPQQNQPKIQNFVIETSQVINPDNKSSKAHVQSLLTNNDNVSSKLSKLFGTKHKSKDSTSILSTELYNNDDSSNFYKQKQKSPVNPYQLVQKQPSPKMRYSASGQSPFISPAEEVKKKISYQQQSKVIGQQPQTKVCLPNSIFFNQTQKVSSINNPSVSSSHIQLVKKSNHNRGNALNQ